MRPCENLSKFGRRATPLPFCRYLFNRVKSMFATEKVAILWVERKSHYWKLWPQVEMWGEGRDARLYNGPYPVICHPPCGPWGKFKSVSRESKEHGIIAMSFVHTWGGIIEHPVGSSLFREYGTDGKIEHINQGDYGHLAIKPTLLYVVANPVAQLCEHIP